MVDFLRSCHSSEWRFYKNDLSKRTKGRFYFAPKVAKGLPYVHYFFSATWSKGDGYFPNQMGPVQEAPRPWFKGNLTISPPPDTAFGSPPQFTDGLDFPRNVNALTLREGIPALCWVQVLAPFLPFDQAGNIGNCCVLAAYARVISALYDDDFTRVSAFFSAWLGAGVSVTFYDEAGLDPAMCIVSSSVYTMVFVSGTANYQQLATQAWDGGFGPSNQGAFSTLPVWMQLSNLIVARVTEDGGPAAGRSCWQGTATAPSAAQSRQQD